MDEDQRLLAEFVQRRSQAAFAQLVTRHIDMVYSTARRELGDSQLAEDVTQASFLLLARKAAKLSRRVVVAGWLFKVTLFAAADVRKARRRRMQNERKAAMQTQSPQNQPTSDIDWEKVSPLLNEAVARLNTGDRDVIILRFFQGRSHAEIAAALGISEDAAKMRVSRAVEKLRASLNASDMQISSSALIGLLPLAAASVAPTHLHAAAIAGGLGTSAVSVGIVAQAVQRMMLWIKIKLTALAALTVLFMGAGTALVIAQINAGQNLPPGTAANPSTTNPSAATQPSLTREQILAIVSNARSRIQDLTVSYSFNATHSADDDPWFRFHSDIIIKGEMVRAESAYGPDPKRNPAMGHRTYFYDGKNGAAWAKVPMNYAFVGKGMPQGFSIRAEGYFQIAQLCPALPDGYGPNDDSLVSILKYSGSILRPELEVIEGHPCYVFDVGARTVNPIYLANSKLMVLETLWLDPGQGFLPVKLVFFRSGIPLITLSVDKAKEILPGLWLPLHGKKVVWPFPDMPEMKGAPSEWVLDVDGASEGKPVIAANTGVQDSQFDPMKNLPDGVMTYNNETKEQKVVGGGAYKPGSLPRENSAPSTEPGELRPPVK
jgi:RNA polymerase sigma factor (sigma-70 family)